MKTFTKSDLKVIRSRGITIESIETQILHFINGFPYIILDRPATPGDGILVFTPEEVQNYSSVYEKQASRYSVVKMVPASGAASRMFKELFSFLENFTGNREEKEKLLSDTQPNSIVYFIQNLEKFAFYRELSHRIAADGQDIHQFLQDAAYDKIISYLILPSGLNYGNLPKGMLLFHHYQDHDRTAFEEHWVESAEYSRDSKGTAHIHFTLSPEHIDAFHQLLLQKKDYYRNLLHCEFDISHSVQSPSTDTIAVDLENRPFRDNDKKLVFRPGGHGALIENLDKLDQDIIFIKNIDNIVPDRLKPVTYLYKKALGGLLISLKQQIDSFLDRLNGEMTEEEVLEIVTFSGDELMLRFPGDFDQLSIKNKKEYLYHKLNRPVRICGMVKNEGEPGGGPFWVRDAKGNVSLQIVESSQVDLKDGRQKHLFSSSTHFNPVDLVCHVKDHKGQKFPLKNYIDSDTGFISIKSKDGRDLKAQELPGLWNGAMADWITIFVEVPLITFNPVKVVNDLLRETHQ
jgi:hypothetical protein